jgi:DNA polymerase III subunit gamma/tau
VALALYRKYRPRTFAEVIGQEHVTEPLMQALRSGRLHHAYLFSGPRGCGKTSSARILARSLNCEQGPTPDPCGTCDSCRSLANDGGGSIDVVEIDAASHGGVDDARELRERAFFAPANSRYKIYVIDEAHMVSSAGFNALLKLVEEPPDYVKFIFATTEPEKVLGTIRSRTHHYPFRLIPPGVLRPYLERITEAEGIPVEPAVFPLVVRAGGGSVRDSLSVLDQLIAGAGPEGVTYARAAALLGVTDVTLIDEMCDALAAGDGAAVYATIDRVAEAGHDPRRFAADLLERLRDLIVLKQVPDAAAKGLIDGPADQVERMTGQAERFGVATLSRYADIVHNGLVEMRGTTAPRLLLELICARMLLPGAEDSTAALLQRLESLERRMATGAGPLPAATPAAASSSAAAIPGPAAQPAGPTVTPSPEATSPAAAPEAAPAPAPAPAASAEPAAAPTRRGVSDLDVTAVRDAWPEIVALVNQSNKRIAALMRDAVVRDLTNDTLVVTVRSAVLAQMLSAQLDLIADAVYEVLGVRWQIRCEVSGDQRPGAASRAASPGLSRTASRPASLSGGRSARPASVPASRTTADSDWPETARPGGGMAAAAGVDDRAAPTGPATRPAAGTRGASDAGLPGEIRPAGSTGRGTAVPRPDTSVGVAARYAPQARVADPEWAGEPPYDPDYDGHDRTAPFDGFDPDDEPLDDVVDEQTARQTSEEQALQLLQQKLGAEKIGEIDL